VERVSVPTAEPPPQATDVKSELPVVGEELVGKALTLPRPEYPPTARSEGVGGRILVRVRVDKKGRVISARSFEGDWRLRAAAIKAATMATFSAERLNDREAAGTIVYTFKP
jgi:TonB family protein